MNSRDLLWDLDYDILYACEQSFPIYWSYAADSNEYCRLWVVKQGTVRIVINNEVYIAGPGEMLLLPYGKGVHISNVGLDQLVYLSILFELKHDLPMNPFTLSQIPAEIRDIQPGWVRLMEEIVAEYSRRQLGYQMLGKSGLHQILVQIARRHAAGQGREAASGEAGSLEGAGAAGASLRLAPLLEQLISDPAQDHSSAALARALGMSEVHMRRLFKKHVGLSPQQYITQFKMNQSKRLLRDTDLTIQEIAYKLGYADANYYSKVFKQLQGRSPSEYRSATSSEGS